MLAIDCTAMKNITPKRWTQKERQNLKKPNTVCCQCWSTRYRLSVLSIKCGGCQPKVLIVANSQKIRLVIIITILTFLCQS